MLRSFLVGLLLLVAGPVAAAPLPDVIDPAAFGAPTFSEDFSQFDWGQDQVRPPKPHRWRTVLGAGGPLATGNRSLSNGSVFVDKDFTGVRDGKPGTEPLGIDPFRLDKGNGLSIIAIPTPAEVKPWVWERPYASGVITTKFSFSQLFGYFEVRARLPVGKGLWPAFWLLPLQGQWPANGELDIFEGLGSAREIYCTVISPTIPKGTTSQKKVSLPFDVDADWHLYGAAWTADEIIWYVDRKAVYRYPTPADMKSQPMFMLLNLTVGGSWGGYPDARTKFPAELRINRVRAWKLP